MKKIIAFILTLNCFAQEQVQADLLKVSFVRNNIEKITTTVKINNLLKKVKEDSYINFEKFKYLFMVYCFHINNDGIPNYGTPQDTEREYYIALYDLIKYIDHRNDFAQRIFSYCYKIKNARELHRFYAQELFDEQLDRNAKSILETLEQIIRVVTFHDRDLLEECIARNEF
jgi:hypothetical protein